MRGVPERHEWVDLWSRHSTEVDANGVSLQVDAMTHLAALLAPTTGLFLTSRRVPTPRVI